MTSFLFALHIDDPGHIGGRPDHEVTYAGYKRVLVTRLATGWRISHAECSNVGPFRIGFPQCTKGRRASEIRHWSALLKSGQVALVGTMHPPISVSGGITPLLFLDSLEYVFDQAGHAADVAALSSMRSIIADADHPAREAALRALDRIGHPCKP